MKQFLSDNKPLVVKILGVVLGFLLPVINNKAHLNLTPDEVKMAQGAVISMILAYGFHQGMQDHGSTAQDASIAAPPQLPVTSVGNATVIVTPAGGSDKQSS